MRTNHSQSATGIVLIAAIASLAVLAPTPGRAASAEEVRNRTLIAQKFEAWRNRTGGPYDLLSEDARWTIVGNSLAAKTYPTRAAFMNEVIHPFNARMSKPLSPEIRHIYAEGDTVIAFFDAAGLARDGQPYENTYAWFLRLQDGRIVEAHAFFDALAFNDLWRRVTPADAE